MPGRKLLIADDSLTIQKVIRLALSNEGYDIRTSADGHDTIQQIVLFRPEVVLIDVSLPGKNAFEVKEEINHHLDSQDVRFVLMSNAFEQVDESRIEEVGFHGRLTKPFDPAHLREVLNEALAAPLNSTSRPAAPLTVEESSMTPASVEDFSLPLQPDEFPLMDPSNETFTNETFGEDLWKVNEGSTPLAQPSSPLEALQTPALPEKVKRSAEEDIKFLTESTMRMTEMEGFEWSLDKEPEATPHLPPVESSPKTPEIPIEDLIRREVQQALEKLVKGMIPQIAEKLIKEEIHRLLVTD